MAAALERAAVEWLRPLVDNMQWDYCVIWKLGDDPSRFIEWGACCCKGGKKRYRDKVLKIKEVKNGDECKDKLIKHRVRTNACKALAKLPAAIPLYSGIHCDVLISKQPRWVVQNNACASDDDTNGTQVFIPITFGVIELYSSKHLPEDQKLTDFISSQLKVFPTQVYMSEITKTSFSLREQICDPHSNNQLHSWLPSPHHINFLQYTSNFDGSCTTSTLSSEHPSPVTETDYVLGSIPTELTQRDTNLRSKRKRKSNCDLEYGYEEAIMNKRQTAEMGPYKSKNLVTERKRRERIKYGMLTLRSIVPNISKMDRLATLDDAAVYIEELHKTIENYCDELTAVEEKESNNSEANPNLPKPIRDCAYGKDQCVGNEKIPIEVQLIEVSQTGTKDFLLKLICEKKKGGFSRLMDAMESLGLRVTDANVTTLNSSVLNVLKVEAYGADLEPEFLKESLIQLMK